MAIVTIQFKRGLSSTWITKNPILAIGEPGFEKDTGRLKIGDGVTPWIDLPYADEQSICSRSSVEDFPPVGNISTLYKAINTKSLYQWNEETSSYEELTSSEINVNDLVQDEGSFIVLYGGSATDNI